MGLQALGADFLHHALHRRVDRRDRVMRGLEVGPQHRVARAAHGRHHPVRADRDDAIVPAPSPVIPDRAEGSQARGSHIVRVLQSTRAAQNDIVATSWSLRMQAPMIDFRKHTGSPSRERRTDPIEIYDNLDRRSDKGPLRPAQEYILREWFNNHRNQRDLIIKLHTGQGKTLIGLLLLQSWMNAGSGPCLYLCPNNQLVDQTADQAAQFGIRCCLAPDDLPPEFEDSEAILITSVQKLFNGRTKFGLGPRSRSVGSIVIDDSHACLDAIRNCFSISVSSEHKLYSEVLKLFEDALRSQGAGSFEDIKIGSHDALLAVPYWEVADRASELTAIVSKFSGDDEVKFQWPLIRDSISDCIVIFSGTSLQITPNDPSLDLFGSYQRALHRVFMSATVNDDSFFIKTLDVDPTVVKNPLRFPKEHWSGEKMVLIPQTVDPGLGRERLVAHFAASTPSRKYGVVALVPSFEIARLWEHNGAKVVKRETIVPLLTNLREGRYADTLVLANRYDGIDLPDSMCRVLIFDSKPFSEPLVDRYMEICRGNSLLTQTRLAQTIEQGLGRHIRGEKDYGVVLVLGADLIRAIQSRSARKLLSAQTQTQMEIGLDVSRMVRESLKEGEDPLDTLLSVMNQCLNRDAGWKDFYVERMEAAGQHERLDKVLQQIIAEKNAAASAARGDINRALNILQAFLNEAELSDEEHGWYLQEMARYAYRTSKVRAEELQRAAHTRNRLLLLPRGGVVIEKVGGLVPQRRIEQLMREIQKRKNWLEIALEVEEILAKLTFGVPADDFESAFNKLGSLLGFACQRPDREWKQGPDNLWCIEDRRYVCFECKSDVSESRAEISRAETGQMNNSIAWFEQNYVGADAEFIMIIPTRALADGAAFARVTRIMRKKGLRELRKNVRGFFQELQTVSMVDLTPDFVERLFGAHKLHADDLRTSYSETSRSKIL
jgi:replicative superfamily II helicase